MSGTASIAVGIFNDFFIRLTMKKITRKKEEYYADS